MTIALSLKVNDGLVLAADSTSTLISVGGPSGIGTVVNVYNNANKIFNLKKGWRIGAVTWGAGNIGNASVATLMKDLRTRFDQDSNSHWTLDKQTYTETGG